MRSTCVAGRSCACFVAAFGSTSYLVCCAVVDGCGAGFGKAQAGGCRLQDGCQVSTFGVALLLEVSRTLAVLQQQQ
jgi:hypothetical protein